MQLYPMGPQVNNSLPVYKPDPYTGLLGKNKTQELLNSFAGGMLAGYQVRPPSNPYTYGMGQPGRSATLLGDNGAQFQPINPSGVYSPTPNGQTGIDDTAGGDGAFNALQMMRLQSAMDRANWGNQRPGSAADLFEDAGGGTFKMKTVDGSDVPISYGPVSSMIGGTPYQDAGMSEDDYINYLVNQYRMVDESA